MRMLENCTRPSATTSGTVFPPTSFASPLAEWALATPAGHQARPARTRARGGAMPAHARGRSLGRHIVAVRVVSSAPSVA
jgi:hypothetical protein